ncbi:subtilisin family serine protease [Deinococcus metalli]|uniref:Serine protease n=1 Tax=Deinococcus metalli TaxID=1141878 RepID=A0A7W8KE78_9DEIO|nr:S8 family serine peptidase [Deinococcus metalli]MBB5375391.1 subtilisin family serine protease [Deinococcus metalli]GHF29640.1 serine protease [Deinococcus metalli]
MKHPRSLFAATLALSLAACSQQTAVTPTASESAAGGTYLVGFRQDGLSSQSLSAQATVQAQAITAAGGVITTQWADISAAAVKLTPTALAKLKGNPLIEYVEQEAAHHALGGRHLTTDAGASGKPGSVTPTSTTAAPYTPSGEFTWGDNALRVPDLRTAGYTGASTTIKVAVCVLDTGIDGNHPEFQRKLKGFKNFTGEANRSDAYAPNDVSHHGTHVSGTVFAQYGAGTGASGLQPGEDANGVGGVATGADLYMGRVLGDTGSGSSSGIINGLNWCAAQLKSQGGTEDKVVVSMSLGGGSRSTTEQRAYTSAYNKGVLIVAATGNDGAAVSYPAAYDNVVGVAAVDNTLAKASFSNFGTQVDLSGPGVAVLSSVPLGQGAAASASGGGVTFTDVTGADNSAKTTVSGTIVKAGDGTGTAGANQFCGTSTRNSALANNIALISRGTCTFEEKVANANASGAKAVMIYNNAAGPLGMSLTNTYAIPVVGILQTDGQALLGKLPTTGTVAVTTADYEYFDGTSMATPHVSAAAAVVWAAKPTLTNAQLLSLLTSTARDLGTAGKDNNFGYGLVDPYKAITGR